MSGSIHYNKQPRASALRGLRRYLNCDLSWLQFNRRILGEALDQRHPLLERLRFLSICAANLDEFYMVRVATLHKRVGGKVGTLNESELAPHQLLGRIHAAASRLMADKQACWASLRTEMSAVGIYLVEAKELAPGERAWLEREFMSHIFASLTPIAIDPAHPFPSIQNRALTLAISMTSAEGKVINGLVPIPGQLRRFVRLPQTELAARTIRFVRIESVIALFLSKLFPTFRIAAHGLFRVLRDSEIQLRGDEDVSRAYETELRRRRTGRVVRLEIDSELPFELRRLMVEVLEVADDSVFVRQGLLGLSDLIQLITTDRPDLQFRPSIAPLPRRIRAFNGDIFAAIRAKDLIMHHPYESFDAVLEYLRQAVSDPDVIAIKWTIYRTSSRERNPIIEALKEAAELGKSVTAVIELKARFDEVTNIATARDLEQAGVHVIFGFGDLKMHANFGVIVRREGRGVATYCHISTGDYHPRTAWVTSDLSLFTADPVIGRDIIRLFNFFTGYGNTQQLDRLVASPHGIRDRILSHIHDEIAHARAGRSAAIWAKMNALVDQQIIAALYEASQVGVRIELIVRGVCSLRPGVCGMSENIRVKSIVGRYLEHARVYCFGQGSGLPSPKAAVYISSADLVPHCLDRQVELLAPILDDAVRAQILNQVIVADLKDNQQSWLIKHDGSSEVIVPVAGEKAFNAQQHFMAIPSLSEHGRAAAVQHGMRHLKCIQ